MRTIKIQKWKKSRVLSRTGSRSAEGSLIRNMSIQPGSHKFEQVEMRMLNVNQSILDFLREFGLIAQISMVVFIAGLMLAFIVICRKPKSQWRYITLVISILPALIGLLGFLLEIKKMIYQSGRANVPPDVSELIIRLGDIIPILSISISQTIILLVFGAVALFRKNVMQ